MVVVKNEVKIGREPDPAAIGGEQPVEPAVVDLAESLRRKRHLARPVVADQISDDDRQLAQVGRQGRQQRGMLVGADLPAAGRTTCAGGSRPETSYNRNALIDRPERGPNSPIVSGWVSCGFMPTSVHPALGAGYSRGLSRSAPAPRSSICALD